mmetsp:Transcript_38598/g.70194  ORF Transcript_38598/g.70194 Transcript_38598/m.70194 type:complete len:216 (-) Transcript_38598:175-822(-)
MRLSLPATPFARPQRRTISRAVAFWLCTSLCFEQAVKPRAASWRFVGSHPGKLHSTAPRCIAMATTQDGPTTSAEDQRIAAEMRVEGEAGVARAPASALDRLPSVVIDNGRFKYVLLRVTAVDGALKHLVIGTDGAAYHKDVARPWVAQCLREGLQVEVLGGGRIEHQPDSKTVLIYGFSYGFPWTKDAGHAITAQVCEEFFGAEYKITWSNEGY